MVKKAYSDNQKSGREYERVVRYVESILADEAAENNLNVETKMKQNTCCDPFKGYPPPNPRWMRFTVWAMLAALLAMLVVWSVLEAR